MTLKGCKPAAVDYYEKAVVRGAEDYYAAEGDQAGQWVGRAELVGRMVGVDASEVDTRMLLEAACSPEGERLRKGRVDEKSTTFFDATFSAPKSVSVLYALGGEAVTSEVEAAHEAARDVALEYLQGAVYTRLGKGGQLIVDGEGLFGISYRHRTSRAMEPQLHDHVLIANSTRTSTDGEWRTLDGRALYAHAKAVGMIYQAGLRAELTARLGVVWNPVSEHGQADIVGMDEGLMARWSTRTTDVEGQLGEWIREFGEREGRGPSAVEVGKASKAFTLATRKAKGDEASCSTATLREGWRTDAIAYGVNPDELVRSVCGDPKQILASRPDASEVAAVLDRTASEWGWPKVTEQVAKYVTGGSASEVLDQVRSGIADVFSDGETVMLGSDELPESPGVTDGSRRDGAPPWIPPTAVRYSTRSTLIREAHVIDWASRPGHTALVIDVAEEVTAGLDATQVATVRGVLGGGRPVNVIIGPAGAGKTRMLAGVVTAVNNAGRHVAGVAPSAAAAGELKEGAGCEATTLAALLYAWQERDGGESRAWKPGTVLIVDEAAMATTHDLAVLADITEARRWQVILVGDHAQLGAVGAGGMFAELVEQPDAATFELETIHRFKNAWEADASVALRQHRPDVIDRYDDHGRILGYGDTDGAIGQVARTVTGQLSQGQDVLAMAHTRKTVAQLNDRIVTELIAAGRLDPTRHVTCGGKEWLIGQRVLTRRNDRTLNAGDGWVRNGDRWTVTGAGTDDGSLRVTNTQGVTVDLPSEYVAKFVQTGYASTVHSAQGATVDEAHVIVEPSMAADALYVAMTRGRNANTAHVPSDVDDPDRHGPPETVTTPSPVESLKTILETRTGNQTAATTRRRHIINESNSVEEHARRLEALQPTRTLQLATADPALKALVLARKQLPGVTLDVERGHRGDVQVTGTTQDWTDTLTWIRERNRPLADRLTRQLHSAPTTPTPTTPDQPTRPAPGLSR